jgi:FMN phosphatase YigB (HAD superfamily)
MVTGDGTSIFEQMGGTIINPDPRFTGTNESAMHEIFRNGAGKPVVGLDIDGTLGDYHGHFLQFAEGWLGQSLPKPQDINPGMTLHQYMGVTKDTYRAIKLAYRQGGMKRTMPAYPGAAKLTRGLQQRGAEVWLCTTRPFNRLDNIDPDTQEWLGRNHIAFDAILFDDGNDDGKYTELVRQVGLDRIVAVADDLTGQLQQARAMGIKRRYLRHQPYNTMGVDVTGLLRVTSLWDLANCLSEDLGAWNA